MSSVFRAVASYLGFYTADAPVAVTTTSSDGSVVTSQVATATQYVTPDVAFVKVFIGNISLGSSGGGSGSSAYNAATPASFTDIPLANIDFNPPLSSFTISKIKRVAIRAPPAPADVNWYAGIWAPLPETGRTHDAVARRAPNVAWVWRSNVTVQQAIEHVVPWPLGFPVMDSLHAVLPGLHAPSLQIGFENRPHGTATALPAGAITFMVIVEAEVAGYGMLGTI